MIDSILSGFILIDKDTGPTSHDVVQKMRKITGIKKIGHAGTLDPFASGLLILAIGREATRRISTFVKMDKEYEAEIRLGATTDTYDRSGVLIEKKEVPDLQIKDIKKVLKTFTGELDQIPPMYSAKKINGRKLYELARAGKTIERKPAKIIVYDIKILSYKMPIIKIKVMCSSGTYIRSLAHEIGQEIGTGAFLNELRRTSIGDFSVKKAVKIENITKENWPEFIF